MLVRVTVPQGVPPWEREVADRVWPVGSTTLDLAPAVVAALEANMRSIQNSRIVQVERLSPGDLVAIQVTCPERTMPANPLAWTTSPGGRSPSPHAGFWAGGRRWDSGVTDASLPPELVAEIEAEIVAGRSILTITRLDTGATTTPTDEALRRLA